MGSDFGSSFGGSGFGSGLAISIFTGTVGSALIGSGQKYNHHANPPNNNSGNNHSHQRNFFATGAGGTTGIGFLPNPQPVITGCLFTT